MGDSLDWGGDEAPDLERYRRELLLAQERISELERERDEIKHAATVFLGAWRSASVSIHEVDALDAALKGGA